MSFGLVRFLVDTMLIILSSVILCFQDAIDLISGNYTVSGNSPSPFQLNKFESRTVSDHRQDFVFMIRFFIYHPFVHYNANCMPADNYVLIQGFCHL